MLKDASQVHLVPDPLGCLSSDEGHCHWCCADHKNVTLVPAALKRLYRRGHCVFSLGLILQADSRAQSLSLSQFGSRNQRGTNYAETSNRADCATPD